MIELVALNRQFQSIKPDIVRKISAVIDSGVYILGPHVKRLEQDIAARLGVNEAISVANGTDALVITLEAMGIGTGDEVITTPYTFFATAEAISRVGAKPVFIDIDPDSYNLDPSLIESKINERTKVIIPVHVFGQPADMSPIMELARKHGLKVIEDACQAFGATYDGKPAGSIGDAACFSFFPTKNLGGIGDGGLITTNDKQLAAAIRTLRHHGSTKKYYHKEIGYNSRLDEIQAAILLIMLVKIDDWNRERQRLAARYRIKLANHPHISIGSESANSSHIYHLFCIRSEHRDLLQEALERRHIQTGVYYPCPLHLQEVYSSLSYMPGDLPVAEMMSQQLLALPLSPFLHEHEQDQVIEALWEVEGVKGK